MEPTAERPFMPDYGVPTDLDGVLPWSWAGASNEAFPKRRSLSVRSRVVS